MFFTQYAKTFAPLVTFVTLKEKRRKKWD